MVRYGFLRLAAGALVGLAAPAQSSALFISQLLSEQSRTAFTLQGTGARAVGTGGAFIGVADDATAVSFNPAGLAQLLKPEFCLVANLRSREQSYSGFQVPDSSGDPALATLFDDASFFDRKTQPGFFSVALPFKRKGRNSVLQLSLQRVIDFDFRNDNNLRSRPRPGSVGSIVDQAAVQSGGIDIWSLAFSTELTSRLLVGLSFNHWRGNWAFRSASSFNADRPTGVNVELDQDNELRGWNYNLGVLLRSDWVNVGLVYHAPFKADFTQTTRANFDRNVGTDLDLGDVQVSSQLRWPERFGVGLSLHPLERVSLNADVSRIRWGRATFQPTGTPLDHANFFDLEVASRTRHTTDSHLGIEWIAFLGEQVVVPIRAGAFEEPQPSVDRNTLEQRVYRGFTVGTGLKFRAVTLDLALKRSRSSRNVTRIVGISGSGTDFTAYDAFGREEIRETRIYLSAIFQADTDAVHRILRGIFVGN